ncbi:MAG: hypothetical protein KDD66_13980 [Bdellovibrionales bacterium]|nr:hypothetical protein [Bdellovibrionales bacterium]
MLILDAQVEYMLDRDAVYNYADYAVANIKYKDYTAVAKVDSRAPEEQADGCDLLEAWFNLNSDVSSSSTSSSSSSGTPLNKVQEVELNAVYE